MSINNFTTATEFLQSANSASGGKFWVSMLYMIVGILFLTFLNFGLEAALMVSLFIGIIVGTILLYLQLINILALGILVGSLLFLFIYLMFASPKNV